MVFNGLQLLYSVYDPQAKTSVSDETYGLVYRIKELLPLPAPLHLIILESTSPPQSHLTLFNIYMGEYFEQSIYRSTTTSHTPPTHCDPQPCLLKWY